MTSARISSGLAGTTAADRMEGAEAGVAPGELQDARPGGQSKVGEARSGAQVHAPTETLDEFMLRMGGVKASNSLKRIAWATGKTMQEVVDDLADMNHCPHHGKAKA